MDSSSVRNWLGLYVLILTGGVGAYFFVAPPRVMPLEMPDRVAAAEILIPFLLGQMAAVFRFYTGPGARKIRRVDIPVWVVKGPPILVSIILLLEFTLMVIGGLTRDASLIPSAEAFKAALTFCVAFLNATTVFVISRYFEAPPEAAVRSPEKHSPGTGA
jgi:hypothetical protein